jgi:hypothetical protein
MKQTEFEDVVKQIFSNPQGKTVFRKLFGKPYFQVDIDKLLSVYFFGGEWNCASVLSGEKP